MVEDLEAWCWRIWSVICNLSFEMVRGSILWWCLRCLVVAFVLFDCRAVRIG